MNSIPKIVFMGTPQFGAIILQGLIKSEYKPVLVITAPDKPVGRKQILTPPAVKVMAEKYQILVLQPDTIRNLESEIRNLKPDLAIVAAYGQIIPRDILEIPQYGFLNVHPSLLPRWRGPSPIQTTILNGDTETGVTIIKMAEKVDAGEIVSSIRYLVSRDETCKTLHDKLVEFGVKLLIDTIPNWLDEKIKPQAQDDSKVTYTKTLKREDGKVDWKKSAEEIERQIRAFEVWPESFTFWEKSGKLLRIKILKARIKKTTGGMSFPVGKTLVVPQNELGVQCGKDFLVIEKLQLEGKKEMFSEDFLRGHLDFIGTILK